MTASEHGSSPIGQEADVGKTERIHDVGYINGDEKHVLLGFKNPAILNPGVDFVQVAVEIESARRLCNLLTTFLELHDSRPTSTAGR